MSTGKTAKKTTFIRSPKMIYQEYKKGLVNELDRKQQNAGSSEDSTINSDDLSDLEKTEFESKEMLDMSEETEDYEVEDEDLDEEEDVFDDEDDNETDSASERRSIYDILEDEIASSDITDSEKVKKLSQLLRLRSKNVNILVTGATGVGKSSTINALFNMELAKVGVGVDPETSVIEHYELENLTIWDTPGVGDNVQTDKAIKRAIIEKLNETDDDDKQVIDLVLVILDASSKDLGTTFDLINNVLIPSMEDDASKRILIALNQSDIAMKGAHWDKEKNEPDEVLQDYLEKKAASVGKRINEATGLKSEPIYFCSGYVEEGNTADMRKPYNLTKLLYYIVKAVPKDKRLVLFDNLSEDEENWLYDDGKSDYSKLTVETFFDSFGNSVVDCMEAGADLGQDLLGVPGMILGVITGGAIGAVRGVVGTLFGERY